MPSLRLHEKWDRRFGIDPEIAREVDEFIDLGDHHDIGRGRARDDYFARRHIIQRYGYEGYATYLLHHALDYIKWWIKEEGKPSSNREITQEAI